MKDFKVLVVDDEKDFLEMTISRMQKRNILCESAESGEEAVEKIAKGKYDVVLLDVKMPGMDGIETLREIKKLAPQVEIVMLTGHASVESGIDSMKLGAFDYLMKPVELDILLEKLKDAYDKKCIHEEKIVQARIKEDLVRPY